MMYLGSKAASLILKRKCDVSAAGAVLAEGCRPFVCEKPTWTLNLQTHEVAYYGTNDLMLFSRRLEDS